MRRAFLQLAVTLLCGSLLPGVVGAQAKSAANDSARRAAIRQLLILQRTDSLLIAGIEMGLADEPADPNLPEGFVDSLKARARREVGDFIDRLIPAYDSIYTDSEIQELTVFYRSKLGQRLLETQPALMQAGMVAGQQWAMELAGKILLDYSKQPPRKPED